ncbi:ferredoxin [Sphingomonas kyeonggiensis]|uniref:hypothetical protein n=1 Tax=Sphingomonas kyeonggiensis TaxID=1268553 RepID=UPI002789124E|nr:hypothetical protein [Sphingomonas kyeonggiensis]MDQ0249991.1 ferredoxin [Sphingomonas kyeonggiensis]
MTKIDVKIASEYGIMFLYDASIRPYFPSNAGEQCVTYTDTCIAFSVLSYVDGDANVVLMEDESDITIGNEVFYGELLCPSKALSLFDTDGRGIVTLPLKKESARISIRMSEDENPDLVECLIEGIDSF